MNKPKPITPYARLVAEARQWAFNIRYRHRTHCLTYSDAANAGQGYRLDDLRQHILAGEKLGYDVEAKVKGDAVVFEFVKRPEPPPYAITP